MIASKLCRFLVNVVFIDAGAARSSSTPHLQNDTTDVDDVSWRSKDACNSNKSIINFLLFLSCGNILHVSFYIKLCVIVFK